MKFVASTTVAAGALLLLSSCAAPGFGKQWQESVAAHPGETAGITGPWEGAWTSTKNGHTGKLRCIVKETGTDRYRFLYWAQWAGFMKGTFRIDCVGQRQPDGSIAVEGEKRIFPAGTYTHSGTLSPEAFSASFRSTQKNVGSFELQRPE